MSVYKPAKSRYWQYDFIIGGVRYHGSTGQLTRRAAEKAEEQERRRVADGSHGSREGVTLDQACGRWWDDVGQHRGDAVDVERRLERLIALIGGATPLKDIDADTVAEAIRKRRQIAYVKGKGAGATRYLPTPATVNRDVVDQLRPVLRYAEELWARKGLKLQPIRWGKLRLEEPAGLVKVYREDEQAAWRAECGPTVGLALELLLTYGPRFGELFFEPDDFDPDGPRLNIKSRMMPDGERRRGRKRDVGAHTIPLREEHAREIAARVGRAKSAKPPLDHIWYLEVKDEKTGAVTLEPLTYYGLQARLNSAAERAKVSPGRRIHGARHHAGTVVLRRSGNLKLSQRLLGHANIQSTMRYAHALEEDLRAALEGGNDGLSRNNPEPANDATGTDGDK
jgi:integrase